jgi:hypothetical protein
MLYSLVLNTMVLEECDASIFRVEVYMTTQAVRPQAEHSQRRKHEISRKNAVFWNVAPCRSCVNRRFGGTYRLYLQSRKIRERGTNLSRWLYLTLVRSRL